MKSIFTALVVTGLAIGWTLLPREAGSHGSITTTVLFDREIVRILNTRCVACHMDGGIAFPLSTYEETWLRRDAIRTGILRRHMPPWAAVSGYGDFANDNGLTLRETQFLVSWVEGLGPRNAGTVFLNVSDAQAAPREEVRATAHAGHWQLGQPDVVRVLDATTIAAGQGDTVRRVVIDADVVSGFSRTNRGSRLASERRIRAVEYLPGDRRVVRGAVFSVQQTGQWLGSWTPWYGFTKLPNGVAVRLSPGARIVVDVYYRGTTVPVVDAGTIGLFLADGAGATARPDLVLQAARDASGLFRASLPITADTRIWALRPDIDVDAASVELAARRPDGGTDILLYARDARAEWPTPYILKEPRLVRRGSQLSFVVRVKDGAAPKAVRLIAARY